MARSQVPAGVEVKDKRLVATRPFKPGEVVLTGKTTVSERTPGWAQRPWAKCER
jgi:hypothetical protein